MSKEIRCATATLKYKEKNYVIKVMFDKLDEEDTIDADGGIDYMFKEGNYSCDCNKSSFIQEQCDKSFPDMNCGDKIELVHLDISSAV